jgi:hypothetical protein
LGVVLWIAVFGFAAVRVDAYQESPVFAQRIAESTPGGETATVGVFRHFRPSYVFYTDGVVEKIDSPDAVRAFFAANGASAFVITNDGHFDKLRGSLPPDVTVLETRRRLGQRGSVLLLGRGRPSTAAASPDGGSNRQLK